MSIFDRLGRVARSEVTEMKRVLRDARDHEQSGSLASGDPWDDRLGYEADIAAADAELARDLGDPLSDVFARELGAPPPAGGWGAADPEMAQGASLWSSAPRAGGAGAGQASGIAPEPTIDAKPVAPGWIDVPTGGTPGTANPWGRPAGQSGEEAARPAPGRTESFPREVREAYAVLELPMGSDRNRIDQAFRALLKRYHPDHHAGQPELQKTATDLTIKLGEARDLLHGWLEGRL